MKTYYVSCKKYTSNENSNIGKAKQNRLMLLLNCAIYGKKKSAFVKNKELNRFTSELHLEQPGFTYSAFGPFNKHCERIKEFRETGSSKHLNRNELDKACFAHDATYPDSKDLAKRTIQI